MAQYGYLQIFADLRDTTEYSEIRLRSQRGHSFDRALSSHSQGLVQPGQMSLEEINQISQLSKSSRQDSTL